MHNHIIRFHKKKKRLIKLRCIKIFIQGNDKQLLKRLQHMWLIRRRTILPERHHVKRHRNDFNGPTLRSERLKGNFIYLIYFIWYNFSSYQNIRYLEILTVKLHNFKSHPVIHKKLSIWIQFEFNSNSVKYNNFIPELSIWI